MNFKELIWSENRLYKDDVTHIVSYLEHNPSQIHQFYDFFKIDDDQILLRSSWILLNACKKEKIRPTFLQFLPKIYPLVKTTSNTSFLRNGLRYFIELGIPKELKEDIINFSFVLLEDKYQEVAILNNAFSLIEKELKSKPILTQSLYETTLIIKDHQPISFQTKFDKFIKRHSNQIRVISETPY